MIASSVHCVCVVQEMDDEAAYQAIRDNVADEAEKTKMMFVLKKMHPEERKIYLQHLTPKELIDIHQ